VAVIGCWALLAPRAAAEDTGFEAGLRVGYGIPLGSAAEDVDLSDAVGGQVPLILDLGYRVTPNVFVGLYFQYGFAWVGGNTADLCDASGADCSAQDIRLGLEGHFHFSPRENLDPWIGLGFGYEWAGLSVEGGNTNFSTGLNGFEFINLQAGLDIRAGEHFYVGPFLTLSVGQYSEATVDCESGFCGNGNQFGASGDIDNKAMHEWLLLGVRGAYAP
jgi:hypothetical protein